MKKSRFRLTHLHSTTLDPGYLVPFLLQPTLPNDSFRIGLSTFIRAQPMLAPLMHEVRLFTQYWFVPYRILWDNWEEFITGGQDLAAMPAFPTITSTADDAEVGSLWDYFGFPRVEGLSVSAMPFRALAEIWNTRYRDEDLQAEIPISYDDGDDTITSRELLSPSFSKDYFTTARPFTQRGGDIIVPVSDAIGTGTNTGKRITFKVLYGIKSTSTSGADAASLNVPVNVALTTNDIKALINDWLRAKIEDGSIDGLIYQLPTNTNLVGVTNAIWDSHLVAQTGNVAYTRAGATVNYDFSIWCFPQVVEDFESPTTIPNTITLPFSNKSPFPDFWYDPRRSPYFSTNNADGTTIRFYNLQTNVIVNAPGGTASYDAAVVNGTLTIPKTQAVSGFTIRDLRQSAALQRYAERSLKYGNRYEEFIQREFGIKPRDYRIQRPEYLGGGRGILNISEVLQTAESADTGVGTMRGHGIASISQRTIRFRCPEHGLILGLLSIRPKSVYTQGIDREWLKRSRLDFFTPELASIGMQEVLQQELYAQPDNAAEVFGYSERYQEYRYHKPVVTGEFRDNLSFWNMARLFQNSPALNDEFINMKYSAADFKRPFQIQDSGAHSFVVMLKNHIRAYRPIPKIAKERLK